MMLGLSHNRVIVLAFQRNMLTKEFSQTQPVATTLKCVTNIFRELNLGRQHLGDTKSKFDELPKD